MACGDGANDLLMLAEAGLSVTYRAKPAIRERADVAINFSGLDGILNLSKRRDALSAVPTGPAYCKSTA